MEMPKLFKKMPTIFKSRKAFTIEDLVFIGITVAVVAIVLGISATILTNIQSTQGAGSVAANATGYGLTGINTLASYLPTVSLVAVAAVIVGIIFAFFLSKKQ